LREGAFGDLQLGGMECTDISMEVSSGQAGLAGPASTLAAPHKGGLLTAGTEWPWTPGA